MNTWKALRNSEQKIGLNQFKTNSRLEPPSSKWTLNWHTEEK